MKIEFIAPLVLPALGLGGFALASKSDSKSGKALRGSDTGGLFGGATGEVGIVAHGLCCKFTYLCSLASSVYFSPYIQIMMHFFDSLLLLQVQESPSTEGEVRRNDTDADVEGLDRDKEGDRDRLFDGIAGNMKSDKWGEVKEFVLGEACDGYYDGSIYQVYNGPPTKDHPFDNVVVEVLDNNDATLAAFAIENIPPPPIQVSFAL